MCGSHRAASWLPQRARAERPPLLRSVIGDRRFPRVRPSSCAVKGVGFLGLGSEGGNRGGGFIVGVFGCRGWGGCHVGGGVGGVVDLGREGRTHRQEREGSSQGPPWDPSSGAQRDEPGRWRRR